MAHSLTDLIVAAEECQGGVIAEARELICHFAPHVFHKGGIARIGGAGKGEVLPDKDPVAICQLVKLLRLVDPSTPDTQHIEVRRQHVLHEELLEAPPVVAHAPVVREVIGPLGVEGSAIDHEAERPVRLIKPHLPQPHPEAVPLSRGVLIDQRVPLCLTPAVWHPEPWPRDREGDRVTRHHRTLQLHAIRIEEREGCPLSSPAATHSERG